MKAIFSLEILHIFYHQEKAGILLERIRPQLEQALIRVHSGYHWLITRQTTKESLEARTHDTESYI